MTIIENNFYILGDSEAIHGIDRNPATGFVTTDSEPYPFFVLDMISRIRVTDVAILGDCLDLW